MAETAPKLLTRTPDWKAKGKPVAEPAPEVEIIYDQKERHGALVEARSRALPREEPAPARHTETLRTW